MKIWQAAVFALIGAILWALEIRVDPSILVGAVLFWGLLVVAKALDRHHDEQMAKMADLELYLRSIENRLP